MKRLFLLLIAATMAHVCTAQIRYDNNAWTAATNVPIGSQAPIYTVPYALVSICTDSSCASLVPIYSNQGLTIPISQPFKADALGRFGFWAATGTYWSNTCSAAGKCFGRYITLGASGSGGTGTVTSVGLSLPALFSVTGSPVTVSGTLAASLATQNANQIFAGPASGSAASPTFRSLVLADLPASLFTLTTSGTSGAATYSGGILNIPNYATGGGGSGTVTSVGMTVPSIFGISGSPVTTSGTLALSLTTQTAHTFFSGPGTGSPVAPTFRSIIPSDLPVATASTLGAAQCDGTTTTCSGGIITAVGGGGGGITQLTGDVTAGPGAGSQAATLATSGVTAGSYTSANITVDAKGRVTAAANGSGGGSGISGQAAGVVPLGSTATTIGAQSHIDDGITTAATITATEPIAITGSTHGVIIPAGTAASGAAGKVVFASDSTSGFGEMNQNAAGLERIAGWNTANVFTANQTAPSFVASGSGAGNVVLTQGAAPSATANSVTLIAPVTVTTGYKFTFPAGSPGTASNLLMQCSGTTAALCSYITGSFSTQLVSGTISDFSFNGAHASTTRLGMQGDSSGSDLNLYADAPTGGIHAFRINGVAQAEVGNVATTYGGVSMSGNFTTAGINGFYGDSTGVDPNLYMNAPTGGGIVEKIGNVTEFQIVTGAAPSGSCSSNVFVISTSDGHGTWCNGTTYVSKF